MESATDKELIMSRLPNLKNAEEIYRRCSVRDDYTYEERQQVRDWVKQADQKNKLVSKKKT